MDVFHNEKSLNKRLTITDVAQALGISKTTVSRAISGKGRVGEDTRHRVLKFIEEKEKPVNVKKTEKSANESLEDMITRFSLWKVLLKQAYCKIIGVNINENERIYIRLNEKIHVYSELYDMQKAITNYEKASRNSPRSFNALRICSLRRKHRRRNHNSSRS